MHAVRRNRCVSCVNIIILTRNCTRHSLYTMSDIVTSLASNSGEVSYHVAVQSNEVTNRLHRFQLKWAQYRLGAIRDGFYQPISSTKAEKIRYTTAMNICFRFPPKQPTFKSEIINRRQFPFFRRNLQQIFNPFSFLALTLPYSYQNLSSLLTTASFARRMKSGTAVRRIKTTRA